jgi:two-component system, OmpR family, sensor histidine kinase CreC
MLSIRSKLFIAFAIIIGLGFYSLVQWLLNDITPRYMANLEEAMVDSSIILASMVEEDNGRLKIDALAKGYEEARKRSFQAQIYELKKEKLDMELYLSDAKGTVLWHSENSDEIGKDYSGWNDVYKTLRGEYGARATLESPDDPASTVLYISAPVVREGVLMGVLTVYKDIQSLRLFVESAKRTIVRTGAILAALMIFLGFGVSAWLARPIQRLMEYAHRVRDGQKSPPPKLGRTELGELALAFEEMRRALDGKRYVEEYTQSLTHELKSPIAAIQGASEILEDDLPKHEQLRFLGNIQTETARLRTFVDRMLQLSSLEHRDTLGSRQGVDPGALLDEIIEGLSLSLKKKSLKLKVSGELGIEVVSDPFWLRLALENVIQNAMAFSPEGGTIKVETKSKDGGVSLSVLDEGPGFHGYPVDKAFEKFFSLQRPDTGKKSSGLGLALVKEIMDLHGGEVQLINSKEGGLEVLLTF